MNTPNRTYYKQMWLQAGKGLITKLCCALVVLSAGTICMAQQVITSDSISGQWTSASSPYIITRNIIIPQDTGLIIEPGTEIIFAGNFVVQVDGKLTANATNKEKIVFAFADSAQQALYKSQIDTTAADYSGWRGIRFTKDRPVNDTSKLVYCTISGVRALTGSGSDCSGGGISIVGTGPVIIQHCNISNNQAHIGAAIFCNGNNAVIDGNTIFDNQSLSNGGAICLFNCRPVVKNNIIRSNTSPEFGGGLYCENTDGNFVNNTIVDNQARFGGAISLYKSNIRLINNTIADNQAEINGGGIHCQQSSPYIKNSIVWGNDAHDKGRQLYLYMLGYPDIEYSNIQGGQRDIGKFSDDLNRVSNYRKNFEDDPKFVMDDTALYGLAELSPCIDAGFNRDQLVSEAFDMQGHPRIVNNIIDLGAQEFTRTDKKEKWEEKIEIIEPETKLIVNIYPNPNKGKFTVEIKESDNDIALMGIVNGSGQMLYTQSLSLNESSSMHKVNIDFSRGVYFLELKNNNGEVLKREKIIIE